MRKIQIILLATLLALTSCVDHFLERPDTSGNIDLDKVFSSSVTAEQALGSAYRDALVHGWPSGWGTWHGALGSISGERYKGYSWHATWEISESGLKVGDVLNAREGTAGADNFTQNWASVRGSYIIKENIDKVPDMTPEMKKRVKAEATALVAYRYMGMFYRYGGVPIVRGSYEADDSELQQGRASLQETLDFIVELCDEAYAGLPDVWEPKYTGRMTKGAVLAIKARTLLFAARPLFNSASPHLSGQETDNLVCFGDQSQQRWKDAIDAHEAVLSWADANGYSLLNTGGVGKGRANPNAKDDYGTAVSLPDNKEVILAYKFDDAGFGNKIAHYYNTSAYWDPGTRFETDLVGLLTNFLELYQFEDGGEPEWPKVGDDSPFPAERWYENIAKMEPRFLIDYLVVYEDSHSNPGDPRWSLETWNRQLGNTFSGDVFPGIGGTGRGCGVQTKFYYKSGSRVWFEPPLFRMAETYLSLAEAYNEVGNSAKALENLNMVHNRAGLPAVTTTSQSELRELIWREKAVEFMGENHRYFDVKHWKHPRIDDGVIGGHMRELQFRANTSNEPGKWLPGALVDFWDANSYVAYWHPKMYLEPLPQEEVNKGFLLQNPGY